VQDLLGNVNEAHRLFQQAIRLYPAENNYHMYYAYFLTRQKDLKTADAFMHAMVRCAPYDPARHRRYGQWLLRNQQREKGLALFSQVFALAPQDAKKDIATLRELGLEEDEIRAALPERVQPHLAYAAYLADIGLNDQASAAYLTALSLLDKEVKPQAHYFYPAISFFLKRQQVNIALRVILQGVEALPGDVGMLTLAGDLYRKMNMPLKARESYRQALQLAPGREDLRKRLKELESQ
jgi:tetratricopeptide (TPR) repeat protein